MFDFLKYSPPKKNINTDFVFSNNVTNSKSYNNTEYRVSENIETNIDNFKKVMHLDKNGDIVMRTFNWHINSGFRKGVIFIF